MRGIGPACLAVVGTLCTATVVHAQPRHFHPPEDAQLHQDFYSKLARPDVSPKARWWRRSCCSNRDCRPVHARFRLGFWEFLTTDGWRRVPRRKMLDVKSPDTRAHACVSDLTKQIYCFVKPDFGT